MNQNHKPLSFNISSSAITPPNESKNDLLDHGSDFINAAEQAQQNNAAEIQIRVSWHFLDDVHQLRRSDFTDRATAATHIDPFKIPKKPLKFPSYPFCIPPFRGGRYVVATASPAIESTSQTSSQIYVNHEPTTSCHKNEPLFTGCGFGSGRLEYVKKPLPEFGGTEGRAEPVQKQDVQLAAISTNSQLPSFSKCEILKGHHNSCDRAFISKYCLAKTTPFCN